MAFVCELANTQMVEARGSGNIGTVFLKGGKREEPREHTLITPAHTLLFAWISKVRCVFLCRESSD